MRAMLIRLSCALVAVACGWALEFLVYISIAGASLQDQQAWAFWTGLFCVAAWVLVGMPLAVINPDLSSGRRIAMATLLCGVAGVGMIAGFFRSLQAMVSIFALLAFLTGAASMAVYTTLLRTLRRA